jgi:putative ABC transport system permease protein
MGMLIVSAYIIFICTFIYFLLSTSLGLNLRALGDNHLLLKRLGKPVELYRLLGFAMTNGLAAYAGIFTAQTIGYADINMGFGMTLTGIGAIILGEQCLRRLAPQIIFRVGYEFIACLAGVCLYFLLMNLLLRLDINPTSLKLVLGMILIIFLRTAINPNKREVYS